MKEARNESRKRRALVGTTFVALFAALIAAGTFIAVPLPFSPVPIVLQNLFAVLAGLLLGPVLGAAAVAVYLLVGAIGVPVFAGATGGFVHFFGATGGYLAGYLLSAIVAGLVAGKPHSDRKTALWRLSLAAILGFLVVYVPGVLRLKAVIGADWHKALAVGFLPFLVGDLVKAVIAVAVAPRLRRMAADQLDA
jgi:biotin transport system substrate-specific component